MGYFILFMVKRGKETAAYLQLDIIKKLPKILRENKDLYQSRNHFINCAINREIRRIEEYGKPNTSKADNI